MPASEGGTARAWGWAAHLRDGGTTPWPAWTAAGTPTARVLPGAQQLELVRRLNLASSAVPGELTARVLTAAAPGRGKPDLPLEGVGASPYGPQPVDPTGLSPDELIRVATSVLAEDVVALGVPTTTRPLRGRWRRDVMVLGNPLEVAHAREQRAGRRAPHRTHAPVLLLGGPLDQQLADVWTRRCFEGGSAAWPQWLRFWQQRGGLPPRIDLVAVADRQRAAHQRVKIVLDPSALPHPLGVRRPAPPTRPGADAAELARRIATVVGLLVPSDERAALMTHTLLPRIPATTTPQVCLPAEHRAWVSAAADRMTRELRRAGYPVVGDLESILPRDPAPGSSPGSTVGSTVGSTGVRACVASPELVLGLAIRMLVDDGWKKRGLR